YFQAVAGLRNDRFNLNSGRTVFRGKSIELRGEVHLTSANFRCQRLFRQVPIELLESLGDRGGARHRDSGTISKLYVDLAHVFFVLFDAPKTLLTRKSARARDHKKDLESQARRPSPTIYDSLFLLTSSIGFDRSAFVARPRGCGWQSKCCESSECSIHDEGLSERPIKN